MDEPMPEQRPLVGVGVMIFKDGKVLLGKRKGSHAAGRYASPGGHMEHMESFEECAKRETMEECGIEIQNIRFQYLFNLKNYAPKHYVHVGLLADWKSGKPQVLEPEKCESWDWYSVDNLPEPSMETTDLAMESLKTGKTFFDS